MGDRQSQKAGEGSTQIQAGGNVNIGLSYADVRLAISEERERIVQQVWERAQEMLRDAGVQAAPVTPKIVPLLQYASLEQDPDLQERWAALLANATCSRNSNANACTFSEILSQLAPNQVKLMDGLYEVTRFKSWNPFRRVDRTGDFFELENLHDLAHSLGIRVFPYTMSIAEAEQYDKTAMRTDWQQFSVSIDNLLRLRLISTERTVDMRETPSAAFDGSLGADLAYSDKYRITELGLQFVAACRPPD